MKNEEYIVIVRHLSKKEANLLGVMIDIVTCAAEFDDSNGTIFEHSIVRTLNNTNACLENATGHIVLEI